MCVERTEETRKAAASPNLGDRVWNIRVACGHSLRLVKFSSVLSVGEIKGFPMSFLLPSLFIILLPEKYLFHFKLESTVQVRAYFLEMNVC